MCITRLFDAGFASDDTFIIELITAAGADTSQENKWHEETFTSGLPINRPWSHSTAT